MKYLLSLFLFLAVAAMVAAESKYICKVSHLGPSTVSVVCTNGADPTGKSIGGILLISCDSHGFSDAKP